MFRTITNLGFLLIIAAATGFLVKAGWIPWAFGAAFLLLVGVGIGFHYRRRRGPQVPLAIRPEHHPGQDEPMRE